MKKITGILFISVILICVFGKDVSGQEPDTSRFDKNFMDGNDTLLHHDIREVRVYPKPVFTDQRAETQYYRLIQRVRKVYPYALKANELLKKYEPVYESMKSDREKRKLMKSIEDELLKQYKEDLKKMSISDGRVLIKLIDRETGRTSYSIIKEFRGGFAATFWQGIARLFKNNLKNEYDPKGEDLLIERIVNMIEYGYL